MMGIFSTSSQFDADVEKATDEKNTSEEWGRIMDICDKVGKSKENAKDCFRSIMKRLNHQDPHIVMHAITLLDACVSNCDKVFHLEVASREFETEYRKLLSRSQPQVVNKLKQVLKKWAEGEFKSDPQLDLICSLYNKLKQEGMDFSHYPETVPRSLPAVSTDPNVVSSQQEQEDIAKAIELSLKESQNSPKTVTSLYPVANLTPRASTSSPTPPIMNARKVRALYDFEAAEDNELTFIAGEIVFVIDDSDPNWWKGYNSRGDGLFPANFVTADLSVEPEQLKVESKKSVKFNESVQVKGLEKLPEEVEINEHKIDRLLHLLNEADPCEEQPDGDEILSLEEQVNSMGPLIDQELEKVDRKHARLTQLSADLVEALNLYHQLMREPINVVPPQMMRENVVPAPKTQFQYPPHPQPSQPIYNGVPGSSTTFPSSYHPVPMDPQQYASMTLPRPYPQPMMAPLPPNQQPPPNDRSQMNPYNPNLMPSYSHPGTSSHPYQHHGGPGPQQAPPAGHGVVFSPNGQPLL